MAPEVIELGGRFLSPQLKLASGDVDRVLFEVLRLLPWLVRIRFVTSNGTEAPVSFVTGRWDGEKVRDALQTYAWKTEKARAHGKVPS